LIVSLGWLFIQAVNKASPTAQELPRGELTEIKVGKAQFFVEIADNFQLRAKGLSGRDSLEENAGMLFTFDKPDTHSFWMRGMNFPLDLVWINGDRVIGFAENAQPDISASPQIYQPDEPVDKVLEVNAGLVKKRGIQVGDLLEWEKSN